jgi:ATP-dependent helicase/nuclease subunit A
MALTKGQQACVDTLGAPLAVSAGAGSGKTFTLTKRIVHALECGYLTDIDEVLAITFTNKAAGEIKSRVKSALRAAGMADQALKVDDAWISTIHGMCSRILRAHALELGIDPKFEIADGVESERLLEIALESVIGGNDDMVNGLEGIDPDRIDALFSEFRVRSYANSRGASVEGIVRELVIIAQDSPEGMDAVVLPPEAPGPEKLLVQLCDAAREAYELASEVKPGKTRDTFLALTDQAIESVDGVLASGEELSYSRTVEIMNAFPVPGKGYGKGTPYYEMVPELAMRYEGVMAEACAGVMRPHLQTLVDIAALVSKLFSQLKREAGVLDNSDLLTFTARALRERPEIAACYADRFKLVMIDEFQDTDQLQVDMIMKLAGAAGERLCVVGDAQQSIYRFRGADVSVYRKHLAAVRAANPEGLIELPDNFRSHADVLQLCDSIFPGGDYGEDYISLHAGRDEGRVKQPFAGPGPRVRVQLTTGRRSTRYCKGVLTDDVVRVQAARLAAQFAEYRRAGHKPGDMVVLLGGMSRADVYAAAMREVGLPCVVAGGSIFNRAPEVALTVRLAQALVNPKGSKALFEVVSSEMFALSTDDLIQLSTGTDPDRKILNRRRFDQGFRNLERMAASGREVSPALANAAALMNRASEQLGRVPLSQIMQGIVVDSGWLSRLEDAGAEGLARSGNVYKVIRRAAELEESSGLGPSGVAAKLAANVEVAREAPGALSAGGGDSVRIMTVHASKGLEFPIVAVAEFGDDSRRGDALERCNIAGRTYLSLDGGATLSGMRESDASLAAKAKKYDPFGEDYGTDDLSNTIVRAKGPAGLRSAIKAFELAGESAETRRLLYVAITRAKEAVVISMRANRTKDDPTGLSKSVWGDVQEAFAGPDEFFEEGVSSYDFGGSELASVSYVHLELDDMEAFDELGLSAFDAVLGQDTAAVDSAGSAGEGAAAGEGARAADSEAGESDSGKFDVPVVPPYLPERGQAWRPGREGVFSYSSISGEHGEVVDASQAFWADEAAGDGSFDADALGSDTAPVARLAADADSATTFGQAFHRLAQYAVNVWEPGQGLAASASRRRAVASAVGLRGEDDLVRLDAALDRWFGSSLAARVAEASSLRAEVPFMLDMGDGAVDAGVGDAVAAGTPASTSLPGEAFLEGEIDLLATSDAPGTLASPSGCALVVDYKTGGDASESATWLHEKHLLQATCYAYAVLLQGYEQVECDFVRVEQVANGGAAAAGAPASANEPQVVSYTFAAADLPDIKRAIVTARASSLAAQAARARRGGRPAHDEAPDGPDSPAASNSTETAPDATEDRS